MVDHQSEAITSPVSTWMGDHPDLCCCYVSVAHDHAMPCCVPLPIVERFAVLACKGFLDWSQTHKKARVCTAMPMW